MSPRPTKPTIEAIRAPDQTRRLPKRVASELAPGTKAALETTKVQINQGYADASPMMCSLTCPPKTESAAEDKAAANRTESSVRA